MKTGKRPSKKTKQVTAPITIKGCNFTVMPEATEAVVARAESIKAVAEAFSKVADALKAGTNSAPLIEIKSK